MTELVDAQFYTSLKTTLVPTNGAGTPTFTRATTKNIFDNEGKLITVKSGAVTLGGARCAQNLVMDASGPVVTSSENFTNADKNACTLSYAAGIVTATVTGATSFFRPAAPGAFPAFSVAGARPYLAIKARGVGGSIGQNIYIMSESPSETQTPITITLTSDWQIVSFYRPAKTNDDPEFMYLALNYASANVSIGNIVEFKDMQVSPYVCDYVSSGVLSSPWHGAGADGIKYFDTDSSGVAIPDATMLGAHIDPASKTNNLLYCRDLTNAAWVKTNATAAKTQTGIDAVANSCSLLTATAANATILQTITAAATAACSGFWVKRSVGTGSIFFTRNGGVDWLDITSLINSSTFTCVKIENTSVTNPQVGFKIATSGDAIIVDAGLNHAGTTLTLPIFTTSAAVTRAADVLTYQTASNFSDTAGTILATYKPTYDTCAAGSIVGSSTSGLYASTSNSGVQALDGTNTINGPAGTPSGQIKIGARWSGSSLQCFALDSFGSSGSYDGSFNLSTIGILPGTAGYIRDLAIWTSSLTDSEISDAWNLIAASSYITSGSLVGMQSILSSSTSSMSTVIYGTITATYTVPTIEAEP